MSGRTRRGRSVDSQPLLADTVVEHEVSEEAEEVAADVPKWNEVLNDTIRKSFRTAKAALHREYQHTDKLKAALHAERPEQMVSAFRCSTLLEKEQMRRVFRLPIARRNPVQDDMADTRNADAAPVGTVKGVEFDMLLEEELYNASGKCLSVVRVYDWHEWDERVNAPNAHGPIDERMGPVRSCDAAGTRLQCPLPYCGGYKNVDQYVVDKLGEPGMCVGHFGHIMLPAAVWLPLCDDVVQNMLRSFCWNCGMLPGTDEQNRRIVAGMYGSCETRTDKLAYLDHAYRKMKCCVQCSRARQCRNCTSVQCADCASFTYFRPLLRTIVQARNAVDKLRDSLIEQNTAEELDDDTRRAARGSDYSGFPCDVLLNGNASAEESEQYARFAREIYGRSADSTVLIMHGERVRAVIAQMSDDYLRLFFDTSIDTCDEIRAYFRSMVPRCFPVLPNNGRPTEIVGGGAGGAACVRTDDLTKRYKELTRRCETMSRAIDSHAPRDNPAVFYNMGDMYGTPRNTWFKSSDLDFRHIEIYGEIQYYSAAIADDVRALKFLPALASQHGIGRSAAARNKKGANDNASAEKENRAVLIQSIVRRLKGKPGRVRGNLQGKRVEIAARSVITPCHRTSIRGVCLPIAIVAKLVIKDRINSHNAKEVLTRAERARIGDCDAKYHPGCKGCAECQYIAQTPETELCIFSASGDERIRITGHNALPFSIWKHPLVHEPGAIVERTLQHGDTVLLNRQPSLHQHSTMGHRVIISRRNALAFNEQATTPYNADYDGDEMNVHVPSSLAAKAELDELMAVEKQLITASDSTNVHPLKQEGATGMYGITSPDTFLTRAEVCDLMLSMLDHNGFATDFETCLPEPAVRVRCNQKLHFDADGRRVEPEYESYRTRGGKRTVRAVAQQCHVCLGCGWIERWTGLQIANFVLPREKPYLNYKKPENFEFDDRRLNYPKGGMKNNTVLPVVIINSELICGRIDKSVAGSSQTSVIRAILNRPNASLERSQTEAADFVDRCAWLASAFLTLRGFSTGLGDCMPRLKPGVAEKIEAAASSAEIEIEALLKEDAELMRTGRHADRVTTIEERVMDVESKAFTLVTNEVIDAVEHTNSLNEMLQSGGKGKPLNIAQIAGALGGQQVEGRRACDNYLGPKAIEFGAGAGSNANKETTSGGSGLRIGRPTRETLDAPISTRRLDNLLVRGMPHEPRGKYPGAEAGGFVKQSFIKGLRPLPFFNHAKSGREGLIDTACKTATTGDAQRLAQMSCMGIVVRSDGTVRSETNQLVSFRYGGNNYDARALVSKSLQFIAMSENSLARSVFYDHNDVAMMYADQYEHAQLEREQTQLRNALAELRSASSVRSSGARICTPGSLTTVINEAMRELNHDVRGALWYTPDDGRVDWHYTNRLAASTRFETDRQKFAALGCTPLTPAECALIVEERCDQWCHTAPNQPRPLLDYVTECEIRLRLCSKQVTRRLCMSKEALVHTLDLFETVLVRATVQTGESAGTISVQAIGQPATQMTLNTFHFTGKRSMGVLSGVPRMNELGLATKTATMKALKVVMPLRAGMLLAAGQRKLAAQIAADLVIGPTLDMFDPLATPAVDQMAPEECYKPEAAFRTPAIVHNKRVARLMAAPMRHAAQQRFADHRRRINESLCAASQRGATAAHQQLVDQLLTDIDRFFVVTADDHHDAIAPVRTLHSLTSQWLYYTKKELTTERGWNGDAHKAAARCHNALVAKIQPAQRTTTTPALMCESVWRALLPIFGKDAAFVVVPRMLEAAVTAGGAKSARAEPAAALEGVAIVALDCTASYEQQMYEHIRLHRDVIFIDLLEAQDAATTTYMSQALLHEARHQRPVLYMPNVAGTAEKDREDELMYRKIGDLSSAQTRHLFTNLVSTCIKDIVENITLVWQPLSFDPVEQSVTVRFPDDDEHEDEREQVTAYYGPGCFDMFEVGCQRPDCVESGDATRCGCLSSWMLSAHLSADWFLRNQVDVEVVRSSLERALGPFYHVFITDINCVPVALHVRVYTCQLDSAFDELNRKELSKLDELPADWEDREAVVLDRAKWLVLNYAFSGPLHGNAVMCEDMEQQVFTNERGLERVQRTVLVNNSADLYHMMGLRGIDARRVRSNSIHDMLDVIGVEAARTTAINEYTAVFADGGSSSNRVHYALRADVQTRNGGFLPLSAAGLRSAPHDVCQSAAHRETAKMFVRASLKRRTIAPLVSPAANVMFAQPLAQNGTGAVNLMPDVKKMCEGTPPPDLSAVIRKAFCASEEDFIREWQRLNELHKTAGLVSPPMSPRREEPEDEQYDEDELAEMQRSGACFSPIRDEEPTPPPPPLPPLKKKGVLTFDEFMDQIDEGDSELDAALLPEPAAAEDNVDEFLSAGEEEFEELRSSTSQHPALTPLRSVLVSDTVPPFEDDDAREYKRSSVPPDDEEEEEEEYDPTAPYINPTVNAVANARPEELAALAATLQRAPIPQYDPDKPEYGTNDLLSSSFRFSMQRMF